MEYLKMLTKLEKLKDDAEIWVLDYDNVPTDYIGTVEKLRTLISNKNPMVEQNLD